MAPHSSTLAWKIPRTEEPGRLQSMGSQRVRHERLDFDVSLSCTGEGNGNPLQCSCLENPKAGRAWRAAVYGVAQSRTRLERLGSSSKQLKTQLICNHSSALIQNQVCCFFSILLFQLTYFCIAFCYHKYIISAKYLFHLLIYIFK